MARRKVSELLNPNVVCATEHMTVGEVEKLLASRGVSGAPVVDDAGHVLGVVSQHDLVRHVSKRVSVAESGRFYSDVDDYRELGTLATDRSDTPIVDVMTCKVYTINRDAGVAVAANIMRERRIHRLIVTERGRLVGVISSLDLMRVIEESC